MLIVYGPKPGTEVSFPLKIDPPRVLDDGKGGTITLPPKQGVGGDRVLEVTAKVPSEGDRRALEAILTQVSIVNDKGEVQIRGSQDRHIAWRKAVLEKLIVKVGGLKMIDPRDPTAVFEISTPADILTYADDDVINALIDVVMDRIRLNEALLGNFDGRSSSSPVAIPPLDETAANAGAKDSAAPARVTAPLSDPIST